MSGEALEAEWPLRAEEVLEKKSARQFGEGATNLPGYNKGWLLKPPLD
jgi:hypothetical protein